MRRVFLWLAMVLAPAAAAAQSSAGLTFDEALDMALGNNPSVEAARYGVQAAEQERKAAFGLRLPKITAMGSYVYMGKEIGLNFNGMKQPVNGFIQGAMGFLGQAGVTLPPEILGQVAGVMGADWGVTLQERHFGFVGGSAVLPLYMGGKINAANRAARAQESAARAQSEKSGNALISELVERYYGLALAMQVVEVRRQVAEGVRVHLEDAGKLEASGMIAKGERLYAEVKMAEAERELLDARLRVETIKSALANTLNSAGEYMPVSSMFILSSIEERDYFRDVAGRENPMLSYVEGQKSLALEGVRAQRAEFLPQVALMAGGTAYDYRVTKLLPRWAVGATVTINIFDGLRREHNYTAAKYTARRVEALREEVSNGVTALVDKYYNELCSYRDRFPSLEASIAFAEEYLRIKNAAFLEGMAPSSEVIDAELNLAKVRTERLEAAYNYDVALAHLLETAGISGEFPLYGRRSEARPVTYNE